MRTIVIVFLGLMAVSDSSRRGPLRQPVSLPPNRIFSPEESNSTQVGIDTHLMNPLKRGGLDPDQFKRHVFILSEICPIKPRKMIFGDEIIVESQHPADHEYRTGVSCSTNFTRTGEDGGIILVLVDAHTADCGDYMRIDPMNDPTPLIFCGASNETGTSVIYENENLQVTWHTELGSGKATKPGTGLRILLTAFQNDCREDQPCFKCDNGLIINQFHMCNGWNNCGDWSDEKICPSANSSRCHHRYDYPRQGHGWLITMSVLFAAACLVAAVLGLMNYNMSRQRNGEPIASGAESRSFIPDFLRRMF